MELAGFGTQRINMAYAYGGYPLTRETVENLLGLPVHRYVGVDFAAFKELGGFGGRGGNRCGQKDALYGQERRPVHRFAARPAAAGRGKSLAICEIPPGSAGDITRVRRQQLFLSALAGELKKGVTPGRLFSAIRISRKYLQTDLTAGEIFALYYLFTRLDLGKNLSFTTLPGEFYESYWRLHEREVARVLAPFAMTGAGTELDREE